MTFGEELRSISQSLDMEKKIFEEMKKKVKRHCAYRTSKRMPCKSTGRV